MSTNGKMITLLSFIVKLTVSSNPGRAVMITLEGGGGEIGVIDESWLRIRLTSTRFKTSSRIRV